MATTKSSFSGVNHLLFDPKKMGSWGVSDLLSGINLPLGDGTSLDPKAMSTFSRSIATKSVIFAGVTNAIRQIAHKQLSIVQAGESTYVAEVPLRAPDGTNLGKYLVTSLSTSGEFNASICTPAADGKSPPTVAAIPAIGSANLKKNIPYEGLYAPLLPFLAKTATQCQDDLNNVIAALTPGGDPVAASEDDIAMALFRLNNGVQWGVNRSNTGVPTPIIPDDLNIPIIKDVAFANRVLNGDVVYGNEKPVILNSAGSSKLDPKKIKTFADACEAFEELHVPIEEIPEKYRPYIPTFKPDFPVPTEVVTMLFMTSSTSTQKEPFRNFLWRGETGFGKSTGAGLYAAVRGLPLMRLTCSPTMERQDFLASFVPNESGSTLKAPELPSWDFIVADSESSYTMVTGEEKDGATPQDVLDAYADACKNAAATSSGHNLFKLVESDFITALQYGFVVEVQELSAIRDPGVMLSINEYDRPGAIIPLIDGRKVRRHDRSVVIATDNPGYEGTNPINQAVLRRFAMVFDSWDLPEADALKRVVYNTGFSDNILLKKMYKVWNEIRTHCQKKEYTEGDTSIIGLENWAKVIETTGLTSPAYLRSTCICCVVAKATARPEEQDDIITAILDTNELFGIKRRTPK